MNEMTNYCCSLGEIARVAWIFGWISSTSQIINFILVSSDSKVAGAGYHEVAKNGQKATEIKGRHLIFMLSSSNPRNYGTPSTHLMINIPRFQIK